MRDGLHIDAIVVRAPFLDEADAHRLVNDVADALVRRFPQLGSTEATRIGDIALEIPAAASRDQWPTLIADRLIESILAEVTRG